MRGPGEADLLVQQRGLAVRDVAVGQADAQDARRDAPASVSVSHTAAAEAAGEHALLDRDEQLVLGGELRRSARASIGLAKRASATVTAMPCSASRSAASSALPTPLP